MLFINNIIIALERKDIAHRFIYNNSILIFIYNNEDYCMGG